MSVSVYIFEQSNLLSSRELDQLEPAGFVVSRFNTYSGLKAGLWNYEPDYLIWIWDSQTIDGLRNNYHDVIKNFPAIPLLVFGANLDANIAENLFKAGVNAVFPFKPETSLIIAALSGIEKRKILSTIKDLKFLDIELQPDNQIAMVKNNRLRLTKTEFRLLSMFLKNQKKILKKERLIEFLWKEAADDKSNYDFLYAHIKNLRKKLALARSNVNIRAVYSMGYKLTEKKE